MQLYQLKDCLADAVGPVFEAKNDDVARRVCRKMAADAGVDLKDFALYCVGERVLDDVGIMVYEPVFVEVKHG